MKVFTSLRNKFVDELIQIFKKRNVNLIIFWQFKNFSWYFRDLSWTKVPHEFHSKFSEFCWQFCLDFLFRSVTFPLKCHCSTLIIKPLLCLHFKSQKLNPSCSVLSIFYFNGGFSRSCFENWAIFGVKSVKFFGGFLKVDLS